MECMNISILYENVLIILHTCLFESLAFISIIKRKWLSSFSCESYSVVQRNGNGEQTWRI